MGGRRATPLPEAAPRGLTVRQAARLWGCSRSAAARRLAKGRRAAGGTNTFDAGSRSGLISGGIHRDQAVGQSSVCPNLSKKRAAGIRNWGLD
jgi:hypothetical protein